MAKHLSILISLAIIFAFGKPDARRANALAIATAKRSVLRVMTYNIHVGVGMDQKQDLQRIADVINKERPDLVGLQEVDRGVRRTQGVDEIAELSKLTSMEFAFAHNLDYQGGEYGVAILSRFPIKAIDHRKFENHREAERRGMIRIEVDLAGRTIHFVTTHLDYQYAEGRLFETEQLLRGLEGKSGPIIVVGDFNDEPAGEAFKLMSSKFEDAWSLIMKDAGFSYPADNPAKSIDFIFFRSSDGIKVKRVRIARSLASDHLPVVADLEFK